jgi:hypothetical protein
LESGSYSILLNDTALNIYNRKNAKIILTQVNSGINITLLGTSSAVFNVTAESDKTNGGDEDDDALLSQEATIGIAVAAGLVGITLIGGAVYW